MEWGAFWSSHIPTTHVDEQLDAESVNPGQQVKKLKCHFPNVNENPAMSLLLLAICVGIFGSLVSTTRLRVV
jgi:hexokinase